MQGAQRDRVGAGDRAGLQPGGQRRIVRDADDGQALELRLRQAGVPVVRVGNDLHALAGLPRGQLERPGAHGAAGDRAERLALGLDVLLLQDLAGGGGQLAQEPLVRLLERDGERLVAGGGHRLDPVEAAGVEAAALRVGRALQAEDGIGGGDRRAVPELRVGVDREVDLGRGGAGHRGQAVADRHVRLLPQQRVAQQRIDGVLGVVEGLDRVERLRLPVGRPGQVARGRRPGRRQHAVAGGCSGRSGRSARWGRRAATGGQGEGAGQAAEPEHGQPPREDQGHRVLPSGQCCFTRQGW